MSIQITWRSFQNTDSDLVCHTGPRFCIDDQHPGGMMPLVCRWHFVQQGPERPFSVWSTNFRSPSSVTLCPRWLSLHSLRLACSLSTQAFECFLCFIQNFSPLVPFFPTPTPTCLLPLYLSSRIYLQAQSKASTFPSQHFTQFVFILWSCMIIW